MSQQHQLSNTSPGAEDDGDSGELVKDDGIPPKPKRPLTVFNLFGKLERNYILQSSQKHTPNPLVSGKTEGITPENAVDPYLELRPEKYRSITLPYDWFKVGKNKKKRQFHQNHGVIKFKDLSKLVSKRWNEADNETRQFCKTVYDSELAKYHNEVNEYIDLYGKAVFDSQKSVYKRRASEDDASDSASSESFKKPAANKESAASSGSSQPNRPSTSYAKFPCQVSNVPIHGDAFSAASHYSNQVQNGLYQVCAINTNAGGSGCNVVQHYAYDSSYYPLASYYQVNQLHGMACQMGHVGSPYADTHNLRSHHSHLENQITVPIIQATTRELQYQCCAAYPGQPHCQASDHQYHVFNELSNESNHSWGNQSTNLSPMRPLQNPTNQTQQSQNQPPPRQSHYAIPMYPPITTNELLEGVDRQIDTKSDDDTNIEGNIFGSDSESDLSLTLLGNDICNILCGEELENAFDSESEPDHN